MKQTLHALIPVLVVALLLAAGPAAAQMRRGSGFPGGGMGGGGMDGDPGMSGPPANAPPATLTSQFEAQLDSVRTALKLTPAQQPLWQRYQDHVMALMSDMTRDPEPAPEGQSAPQKIDRNVNVVRDRLTAMEDIAAAASSLYDVLDAAQKKTADLRLAATVPPLYSGLTPQGGGRPPGGGRTRGPSAGGGGPDAN